MASLFSFVRSMFTRNRNGPQTYDAPEAIAEATEALADLSPELRQDIMNKINAELTKPETSQNLLQAVKELGDAAIRVNQTFGKVSAGLDKVDQTNYKDNNGNPIPKLKPTWDEFHNRFGRLLWGTKNIANDTAIYIYEFYKAYLPAIEKTIERMATATPEEKKDMIKSIQRDCNRFSEKKCPAAAHMDDPVSAGTDSLYDTRVQPIDLLRLKKDIEEFKTSFKKVAEDPLQELKTELEQVGEVITQLNLEIVGYTIKFIGLGVTTGAAGWIIGGLVIKALDALGAIGPTAAVCACVAGVLASYGGMALEDPVKKVLKANAELKRDKAEKDILTKQANRLKELESKLKEHTPDIDYIANRLGEFANIWDIVADSARNCGTLLEGVSETENRELLKCQVTLLGTCYANLYVGLNEYARMIRNVPVPGHKVE